MIGLGLGGWGGLEEKWHGGILPGYVIGECRTTQTELYFGATIDKACTGLLSGSCAVFGSSTQAVRLSVRRFLSIRACLVGLAEALSELSVIQRLDCWIINRYGPTVSILIFRASRNPFYEGFHKGSLGLIRALRGFRA